MSDNLDYVTYIHLHTLNYLKLSPPTQALALDLSSEEELSS